MDKTYKVVMYKTEGEGTYIEEGVLEKMGIENVRLIRIDDDDVEIFFKEAEDADGAIIVYAQMTKDVLSRLEKCQVITTHTIGINQIDLAAATELGICVGNVPDYCIEEVAVHTVALWLDAVRKVAQLDRSVRNGVWDVNAAGKIYRSQGKKYGFVSFGNIPRRTAELLAPFGVELLAFDPFVADDVFAAHGVKKVKDLNELFGTCDYISVHSPFLPGTKHMVSAQQFENAKEGLILIGTGRGGVIDEQALRDALESGKLTSAGIDVIENEDDNTSALKGMEQVTMTPHAAYYSEDSCDEVREKAMTQVLQVLMEKKLPTYLVNKDVDGNARFQR